MKAKPIKEEEVWNLDVTMSAFILPRIKLLQSLKGIKACLLVPAKLKKDFEDCTDEEWDAAMEKAQKASDNIYAQIIRALELNIKDNSTEIVTMEEKKEMEKGLRLLGKHYSSLWS